MSGELPSLDRDRAVRHVLAKQHLAPSAIGTSLLGVVEDLVGLHGTSPTSPYVSLHARLPSLARADLDRELYERRSLIRLKVMRGTVFMLSHTLAPIAHAATRALVQVRDLRFLGLDQAVYDALAPVVLEALGGRSLTVAELRKAMGANGNLAAVVGLLSDDGQLVRDRPTGSWRSSSYRYRIWQEMFPTVDLATFDEEEAIRLLVERYLAAYGPATLSDVAWWTGLGSSRVRRAVHGLGDEIVEVIVENLPGQFLMTREDFTVFQAAPPAGGASIALLPELDPFSMGYKERDRYLAPHHREFVFDRGGNATSVILVDGAVVGVWDVTDRPHPSVRVLLFDPSPSERDAILDRAAAVGAFWAGEAVPVIEYATMIPLTQRSGSCESHSTAPRRSFEEPPRRWVSVRTAGWSGRLHSWNENGAVVSPRTRATSDTLS